MKENRLQNKVATSSFTLPVAALVATLLWGIKMPIEQTEVWAWLCCALSAYLMVEFNNSNALIRIRSRLPTSTYLYGIACCSFLHNQVLALLCGLLLLTAYYFLFRSYQDNRHTANIFHAFVAIGIAALIQPILLAIVPFAYWSMGAYLRTLSFKTFCASLIGMATPVWFSCMYWVYQENYTPIITIFQQITTPSWPSVNDFLHVDVTRWIAFGLVFLLGLISSMHTLRTSYNDKIRTRMLFYTLLVFELGLVLLLAFSPQNFDCLLTVLIITTAPVIAHFFALTHLRITNLLFILALLAYPLISLSAIILPLLGI